jgi:peptide deformylase
MARRDVVLFPDKRLKAVCEPLRPRVESGQLSVDGLRALATDLLDTMDSFPGCVGIAAPQIGQLVRMVAIDATGHRKAVSCHGRRVLVDPVVVDAAGSCVLREGCLSIPDFTANVRRAETVTVEAFTPDDDPVRLECDAFEARLLLHELDHLDGFLFLDRVDSARDVFPRKKYS